MTRIAHHELFPLAKKAWTLYRDHNPAVKVNVAECAHRRVATGGWARHPSGRVDIKMT